MIQVSVLYSMLHTSIMVPSSTTSTPYTSMFGIVANRACAAFVQHFLLHGHDFGPAEAAIVLVAVQLYMHCVRASKKGQYGQGHNPAQQDLQIVGRCLLM